MKKKIIIALAALAIILLLIPQSAYSGEDHPAIPVITTQFFKHGQTLCA